MALGYVGLELWFHTQATQRRGKFILGGHTSPTGNKKLRGIFGGWIVFKIPRLGQRFLYEVNSFAQEVG